MRNYVISSMRVVARGRLRGWVRVRVIGWQRGRWRDLVSGWIEKGGV